MQLEDDSPMPFGKHKGKEMQEVPARWLLDYYHEFDYSKSDTKEAEWAVLNYVEWCKEVLEHEAIQDMHEIKDD